MAPCHPINNQHWLFLTPSLSPSPSTFPSVSQPLQLSFSFTRCPKTSQRCAPRPPPPSFMSEIDILHKSDMRFSVIKVKLMTDGCERRGVELARRHRSFGCSRIRGSVSRRASTSVCRIQRDLLRKRKESGWRGGRLCKERGVRIKVSERPGEIGRRRKEAGIFSFTSFPSVYDTVAINEGSA